MRKRKLLEIRRSPDNAIIIRMPDFWAHGIAVYPWLDARYFSRPSRRAWPRRIYLGYIPHNASAVRTINTQRKAPRYAETKDH